MSDEEKEVNADASAPNAGAQEGTSVKTLTEVGGKQYTREVADMVRDVIARSHPAANLFPMISEDDLLWTEMKRVMDASEDEWGCADWQPVSLGDGLVTFRFDSRPQSPGSRWAYFAFVVPFVDALAVLRARADKSGLDGTMGIIFALPSRLPQDRAAELVVDLVETADDAAAIFEARHGAPLDCGRT